MPTATGEVLLFVIEAGGGHRAAANALVAAAEQTGRSWRFREVLLQEALAPLDFTRRLTGLSMEQAYNALIRRRWTRFLVPLLRVLHAVIALLHARLVNELARHVAASRPAAVVSVLPNFNGVIRDAVRAVHPGVPFLVLLTDFADFPKHFWIEPGVDRVIVGSDEAVRQARALGVPDARISRTSGMVLHPRFHQCPSLEEARSRVRESLKFGEKDFVVLVLFGGKGSPEMRPLVERLLAASPAWQVVAICGDNPALFAALEACEAAAAGRLHRIGFTEHVADYLAASDVLVTKPGPGSLAEAFHQRVPVVVTHDARTIPQERFNARMVEELGVGLAVGDWREAPGAVARLADEPGLYESVRQRLAALPANRAVYEALDIIENEVEGGALRPRRSHGAQPKGRIDPTREKMRFEEMPGGDLVQKGLRDLEHGEDSVEALLVSIAAPRLRASRLAVPNPLPAAEHRLYEKLAQVDPDSAHSRYNALLRRLTSFESALECVS